MTSNQRDIKHIPAYFMALGMFMMIGGAILKDGTTLVVGNLWVVTSVLMLEIRRVKDDLSQPD